MSAINEMPRRRAEVTLYEYQAERYGLKAGTYGCYVLGLFQESEGYGDASCPVFVCELYTGNVLSVSVEKVKFVDNEGGSHNA